MPELPVHQHDTDQMQKGEGPNLGELCLIASIIKAAYTILCIHEIVVLDKFLSKSGQHRLQRVAITCGQP